MTGGIATVTVALAAEGICQRLEAQEMVILENLLAGVGC